MVTELDQEVWRGDLATRQFGGPFSTPAEALTRSGWSRSVGGANPYLALRARGGFSRAAVDAEIASGEIAEVDAARGCTYVVPAADLPLAASLASPFSRRSTASDLKRLGYPSEELAKVEAALLAALAKEELDAAGLKVAAGSLNQAFGDLGKKVGRNDAVSLATTSLIGTGRVRRVSLDGRLDRQRYRYALAPGTAPIEDPGAELASRYWKWIGSATLHDFAGFAGFSLATARKAVEAAGLSVGGEAVAFPPLESGDREVRLVGALDNVAHLRWTGKGPLHPLVREWQMPGDAKALGYADRIPLHMILRGATLIGLWHYDPEAGRIVARSAEDADDVRSAIGATEEWVKDDLGDARTFSLDSPKSRTAALGWLRDL